MKHNEASVEIGTWRVTGLPAAIIIVAIPVVIFLAGVIVGRS